MKIEKNNADLLLDFIPLPFDCVYEFKGHNDLWDARDNFNKLNDNQIIDLLNTLQYEDILVLDERTLQVNICGQNIDDNHMIKIQVYNSDDTYVEDYYKIIKTEE